jgi:predicted CXXCH cytochrome family protein
VESNLSFFSWRRSVALFIFSVMIYVAHVYAVPTHLDKSIVNKGCSGCHKGHGLSGTSLLANTPDELCFECHSISGRGSDIYSEIMKVSRHPVIETSRFHVPGEELPERDPSLPRHVSCYDCHNIHKSEQGNAIRGLRGYSGKGSKVRKLKREYELCYKCHSDSANLSGYESNVALDFSFSNRSYHPVETLGKKSFVPSLTRKHRSSQLIKCSDCHGNDDPSGAMGPHGSRYEPILRYRYNQGSGAESPDSYRLCYECHERTSVLSDESFQSHKVHVVYNRISCAQCHDAHGSRYNPSLIRFDQTVTFPNSIGELSFMPRLQGKPMCLLSCHVEGTEYEHLSKSGHLCINLECPSGW